MLRAAPMTSTTASSDTRTRVGHGTAIPSAAIANAIPHDGRYSVRSATSTSVGISTFATGDTVTTSHTMPRASPGMRCRHRHAAHPAAAHRNTPSKWVVVNPVATISSPGE